MTPSRPSRPSPIHRAVALLTLLAALLMPFEMLIPDVHDGDAHASQLAVGMDAGVSVSAASTSGEHEVPAHVPGTDSPHSGHIEHCTHGHIISISRAERLAELPVGRAGLATSASPQLTSVDLPTHLRPPIA